MKIGVAAAALLLAAGAVLWSRAGEAYDPDAFVRDGEAGFVVTHFGYVLGPDTEGTAACPDGMSKNLAEIYGETAAGVRRAGETDEEYGKRIEEGARGLAAAPDGTNYCANPEVSPPDPHYRTLRATGLKVAGLDLDGIASANDFTSPDGREGIDNQFFRTVGCSRSFQSVGQSNGFEEGMYVGEWGILIKLADVDDIANDDHVEVGLYANADPLALSPTRKALDYATYAIDQDPRFRARTVGTIRDGILRTEPVDVRFHHVVNSMHLERPLRDARIVARLTADGTLKGVLGGFTPVGDLYDFQFGYRNGKDGAGKPSPEKLRLGSSNGAARVLGHTCPGVWHALSRLADGHRDPASGKYTSVSTQYRFEATKAFLVDVETGSANDALVKGKNT